MSEQCSDDARGGRKKRAHVLEDSEEHPGGRADPALPGARISYGRARVLIRQMHDLAAAVLSMSCAALRCAGGTMSPYGLQPIEWHSHAPLPQVEEAGTTWCN